MQFLNFYYQLLVKVIGSLIYSIEINNFTSKKWMPRLEVPMKDVASYDKPR